MTDLLGDSAVLVGLVENSGLHFYDSDQVTNSHLTLVLSTLIHNTEVHVHVHQNSYMYSMLLSAKCLLKFFANSSKVVKLRNF